MIVRPAFWIAKFEAQRSRSQVLTRLRDTAYGRWFAGIEATWLRVMGVVFIAVGAMTVASPS